MKKHSVEVFELIKRLFTNRAQRCLVDLDMEEVFRTSQEFLSNVEDSKSPSPIEIDENNCESGTESIEKVPEVQKNAVHKFQDYILENVNERPHESIDDVIKTVLGSYSLAGYLDHVLPTGKEIIITKLLKECSHLMQELTRFLLIYSFLESLFILLFYRASDSICFTHEDPFSAMIQLIQLQLLSHYPKYRYSTTYLQNNPLDLATILIV